MADNVVNVVITATDNASRVIGAISNGLRMITSVVSDVTKEYIDYGDQVRKLSAFVGTSNEETSRMIQLADDAFVEFETLRLASKNLSEQGIQPTAENMAKLSDEFLRLAPGVERSQFLIDNFGRSGMEMAAIMELGGDKVREMNAAIEDGLIIDEQKAAAIYKTKQELDRFNDSMQVMRFEAAQKMLDIFSAMPQPMKDVVLTLGAVGQSGLLQQLANLSMIIQGMSKFTGVGTILTSIGTGAKALATGAYAALGPIGALAAALTLLLVVIDKFGGPALTSLKQIVALGIRPFVSDEQFIAGATSWGLLEPQHGYGGRGTRGMPIKVGDRGTEIYVPDNNGSIIPNHQLAGVGSSVVNLYYQPLISTANEDDIERLGAAIEQARRRRP